MGFPNVIYGDYGDEKVTAASAIGSLPLGQLMVLPDGSEYVHSRVSATAMVVGKLYQGEAGLAGTGWINDVAVVAGSAVAGANTITITASATTAITKDQFADGFLFAASSTGNGTGWTYKVKSHPAAATTVNCVVTLYESDPLKVTIAGGTTTVGLRVNPFKNVLLTTADTVGVNTIAGVSCASAAASSYVWLQRKGIRAVFTDNTTPIVGMQVIASTTVAGAIGVMARPAGTTAMAAKELAPIGICVSAAASAEYTLVDLAIA